MAKKTKINRIISKVKTTVVKPQSAPQVVKTAKPIGERLIQSTINLNKLKFRIDSAKFNEKQGQVNALNNILRKMNAPTNYKVGKYIGDAAVHALTRKRLASLGF